MKKQNLKNVYAKAFVKKISTKEADEKEGRLGLCIISSGTVDRDGDVLRPEGADFSNFMKNPLLLWSHNSGMGENRPAIGKVEDVSVRNNKIYFVPKFDLKDTFASEVYRKFKDGYLNAFSIGFLPKEWSENETGYDFKTWEALEFSAVNVPANPEALVVLRSQKFDVSKDWKDWKKELVKEEDDEEISEDEKDEEEGWKTFDEVKGEIIKCIKGKFDEKKYKKIASAYAKFCRIPPEVKHFDFALEKVANGKTEIKVKKKKTNFAKKKELLVKLLNSIN